MTISKILFQTSKTNQELYIVSMIQSMLPDTWKYLHFTDDAILDFFNLNPIPEFPDIIAKFNSYKNKVFLRTHSGKTRNGFK